MVFPKKIAHLIIPLITIGFATIYYEENFDWVEEEFSQNLKNWLNRGKFFELQYSKSIYKLFYIFETLPDSNELSPTLLFLHGFPTSSYDYAKVWNLFLNQRESKYKSMLTFDYLGYGFSDKPQSNFEYTIFDMADQVEKNSTSLKDRLSSLDCPRHGRHSSFRIIAS
jgi:pimeloyl-ACP methyl ester carboxylesterase